MQNAPNTPVTPPPAALQASLTAPAVSLPVVPAKRGRGRPRKPGGALPVAARKQRQRDKERHRLVVEKLIELYDKAQPDIYLLTRRPTARQLEKITATRDAERMRRREKHNEFRALSLEDAKMLLAVYEENSDRQGAPENDFKDSKGNKLKIGRIERTGEYGLTQLALMSDAAQLEGMNIARPVRPRGYGPDKYEEREPLEDY